METHDWLAGLGIAVGLAGIVLVVTPGLVIEIGAIFLWALFEQTTLGWVIFVVCLGLGAATFYFKYQRPATRLRESGVPTRHLWLAAVVGFVGLFAIPVVGAPLGFVLTIYVLAWLTVGREEAWSSTKASLRAVAHSVGIELAGGLAIALIWLVAALATPDRRIMPVVCSR